MCSARRVLVIPASVNCFIAAIIYCVTRSQADRTHCTSLRCFTNFKLKRNNYAAEAKAVCRPSIATEFQDARINKNCDKQCY